MVSKFDETLHLMDPDRDARVAGLRAGPCGRGPIDPGATVISMQIWLFQRTPAGVALASGRSGEDVGAPPEQPPYQGKWMIRTGLDKDSGVFDADQSATAMAIAIVRNPDGSIDVEPWEQEVSLHADEGAEHHGRQP